MAPCPYVYAVIGKRAMEDPKLNKESVTSKWFQFYSTEMDELVDVFDQLMDRLTKHCSETEKKIKENFLQSTFMRDISSIWHILMKMGIWGNNNE